MRFQRMGKRAIHFQWMGKRGIHFQWMGKRGIHFQWMDKRGIHFQWMDKRVDSILLSGDITGQTATPSNSHLYHNPSSTLFTSSSRPRAGSSMHIFYPFFFGNMLTKS